MSAGIGGKGPHDYDWAAVQIGTRPNDAGPGTDANRWLLIRRNPSTGELAYYRRTAVGIRATAGAGARWTTTEKKSLRTAGARTSIPYDRATAPTR
jgi:hypothetical protein